jgi:hypothetical protein
MNLRTITRISSCLIWIAFVVGCIPAKTVFTVTPVLSTIEQTSTTTATPTADSTATLVGTALPPTITPAMIEESTPTSISTRPESKWPVSKCPGNDEVLEPSPGYGLPGEILYYNPLKHKYGLIGGMPFTNITLPLSILADFSKEGLQDFGFSSDGRWLAYVIYPRGEQNDPLRNSKNWRLGLFSYRGDQTVINLDMGDVLMVIPEYAYLAYMSGDWINDDLLYAQIGFASGGNMASSEGFILDPFRGVWREDLLAGIPGMDRTMPFAVSPDLSLILYYQHQKGPVLWDIAQRRALWAGEPAQIPGILIRWAPDSSMVAYETGTEQSIIDRNGNVKVSLAELISQDGEGYTFQWSADSRYLAFDVYISPIRVLYIYDTINGQIVYTCPYGGSISHWSPDGNYIAYNVHRASLSYIGIVNLQNGTATKLVDDIEGVLGWSDKFSLIWPLEK